MCGSSLRVTWDTEAPCLPLTARRSRLLQGDPGLEDSWNGGGGSMWWKITSGGRRHAPISPVRNAGGAVTCRHPVDSMCLWLGGESKLERGETPPPQPQRCSCQRAPLKLGAAFPATGLETGRHTAGSCFTFHAVVFIVQCKSEGHKNVLGSFSEKQLNWEHKSSSVWNLILYYPLKLPGSPEFYSRCKIREEGTESLVWISKEGLYVVLYVA